LRSSIFGSAKMFISSFGSERFQQVSDTTYLYCLPLHCFVVVRGHEHDWKFQAGFRELPRELDPGAATELDVN
jgi:hypothetical protein